MSFGYLADTLARQLSEPAVRLDHITTWPAHDVLPQASRAAVPGTLQIMAVPIIMGTDQRLGAVLLARSPAPFTSGEMIAGEMGGPQRTNYTVIGRAANLGARICGVAQGDQVLISQRTYDLIRDSVQVIPLPGQQFKGVGENVTVYHVTRT